MTDPRDITIAKARVLLSCVTFDSDGVMIGDRRQGGNGGLLSSESLRAADELRKAIDTLDDPDRGHHVPG